MYKEKRMNLEYEMFLNGYSIKQISELLNVSYFKVKYDINKAQRIINKEKLLINKSLRISFN